MNKLLLTVIAVLVNITFSIGCIKYISHIFAEGYISEQVKMALYYYEEVPTDGYNYTWIRVNNFEKDFCGQYYSDIILKSYKYSKEYSFETFYFPSPGYYVLALISRNLSNPVKYLVYSLNNGQKSLIKSCTISRENPICRIVDFRVNPDGSVHRLSPKPLDLPIIFSNVGSISVYAPSDENPVDDNNNSNGNFNYNDNNNYNGGGENWSGGSRGSGSYDYDCPNKDDITVNVDIQNTDIYVGEDISVSYSISPPDVVSNYDIYISFGEHFEKITTSTGSFSTYVNYEGDERIEVFVGHPCDITLYKDYIQVKPNPNSEPPQIEYFDVEIDRSLIGYIRATVRYKITNDLDREYCDATVSLYTNYGKEAETFNEFLIWSDVKDIDCGEGEVKLEAKKPSYSATGKGRVRISVYDGSGNRSSKEKIFKLSDISAGCIMSNISYNSGMLILLFVFGLLIVYRKLVCRL